MSPGLLRIVTYGVTTLLTFVGLGATHFLQQALGYPSFLLLIPVVILTSARWGALVGMFAIALSTAGMLVLMDPVWSLAVADTRDQLSAVAFVCVASLSVMIASKQQRLAQELRANEAELRAIFDLAAVGTGMVNPATGRFIRVNEQLCAMTGFTRDELLAKTVPEITHPDDRDRDAVYIAALMSGMQDRWSTEKRYVHKNGTVVWVLVNGTIVQGGDDEEVHLIAHAADITDRRRADDSLREANRLKDEFLATLSHELRTPLNVVVGWTHLISRDEACPAHIRKALTVIARNTHALRRLTDDLIGLSSVLTGRVRLEHRIVDLSGVLDDAVESISLASQAKGLTIEKDFVGTLLVRGDDARLRQVFWNLLSNAVKFTNTGGAITVITRATRDHISVQVADTGIGIPASFLPYVFDKFRQEDASHTREQQGLGLGLTIARQFTELHGGTIVVHSEGRHRGATFTVTLPAAHSSAILPERGAS